MPKLSPYEQRRKATTANARNFIRQVGNAEARRISDEEIRRAVFDVTYPFGRIALYQAIREQLDTRTGATP